MERFPARFRQVSAATQLIYEIVGLPPQHVIKFCRGSDHKQLLYSVVLNQEDVSFKPECLVGRHRETASHLCEFLCVQLI